jgi:hypothetical protein
MIDETLATYKDTQHEISIHGTDAVLGNDVIDLGIT